MSTSMLAHDSATLRGCMAGLRANAETGLEAPAAQAGAWPGTYVPVVAT